MTCNKPQRDSRQTQSLSPQEPKKRRYQFWCSPFRFTRTAEFHFIKKNSFSFEKKKHSKSDFNLGSFVHWWLEHENPFNQHKYHPIVESPSSWSSNNWPIDTICELNRDFACGRWSLQLETTNSFIEIKNKILPIERDQYEVNQIKRKDTRNKKKYTFRLRWVLVLGDQ